MERQRFAGERGQVLPLVALLLVVAGGMCLVVLRLATIAIDRGQAVTAADAAALAAAADGSDAARALAEANGSRLIRVEQLGTDTRVVVERGQARATARARREGGASGTAAGAGGLAPAMQAALQRAGQLLGQPVPVVSGYRSPAAQLGLWLRRASNPYPVARPGTSRHEQGLAVDVPLSFVPRLLAVGRQAGLCQPFPDADPVHFELC